MWGLEPKKAPRPDGFPIIFLQIIMENSEGRRNKIDEGNLCRQSPIGPIELYKRGINTKEKHC